jgi:hypothetical protein
MKRLGRWLFNGVAAMSLLMLVIMCILWVRSYWRSDQFIWFDGHGTETPDLHPDEPLYNHTHSIICSYGGIRFEDRYEEWGILGGSLNGGHYFDWRVEAPTAYPYYAPSYASAAPKVHRFQVMGLELVLPSSPPSFYSFLERTYCLTLPFPILALGLSGMPALSLRAFRRRRIQRDRGRKELCLKCGYDLRATPNQCPECGTVPKTIKNSDGP